MSEMPDLSAGMPGDMASRFAGHAAAATPRAPLYASLAASIAADRDTADLLLHAPATQRQPVLLFACVHWLLLTDRNDPDGARLARHYPNLTDEPDPSDPWPAFHRFCTVHRDRVIDLLRTRSTQTNEIGRCATLLPALAEVGTRVGPIAHLDVGASAGLNLLIDRYRYRYVDGDGGVTEVGPTDSPVVLECGTRGPVPVPERLPIVIDRLGLDRSPVDVTDADEAEWLRACVWPDQGDRFDRLSRAIDMAREDPPTIIAGDAVNDLATAVDRLAIDAHPVITTSWVLPYLDTASRESFVAELDALGADRDITWCAAECPIQTDGLPWPDDDADVTQTQLLAVEWRGGRRSVERVARAHPHGFWLHWR